MVDGKIISYPTSASGIIVSLKTPTKSRWISPTLFYWNKPEKIRDLRFSHVTRLSKLWTRERTGWMKNQNIIERWALSKTRRDSRILHSRTAKKLADNKNKKNLEVQPSKLLWVWIFGAVANVRTIEENYSLGSHSETYARVVMEVFEAASWFCWTREKAILTPGLL